MCQKIHCNRAWFSQEVYSFRKPQTKFCSWLKSVQYREVKITNHKTPLSCQEQNVTKVINCVYKFLYYIFKTKLNMSQKYYFCPLFVTVNVQYNSSKLYCIQTNIHCKCPLFVTVNAQYNGSKLYCIQTFIANVLSLSLQMHSTTVQSCTASRQTFIANVALFVTVNAQYNGSKLYCIQTNIHCKCRSLSL